MGVGVGWGGGVVQAHQGKVMSVSLFSAFFHGLLDCLDHAFDNWGYPEKLVVVLCKRSRSCSLCVCHFQ